jgi:hypothetical protein
MLAKAKLASSITFIVLASFRIVTYDCQNMFIIQAAGSNVINFLLSNIGLGWNGLPGIRILSYVTHS